MKKIIQCFLIILFLFGNIKSYSQGSWGSWSRMSCFKGFQWAVLTNGYVKSINQYSWQAKIKSNYSQKVSFNMAWSVGGERVSIGQVTLNPGQEYSHTSRYFSSNANQLQMEVTEVCFGNNWMSCKGCYANCDNGTPNQPDCSNTSTPTQQTNNNSNQNSTYQIQQQDNSANQQRELVAKQKSDEEFARTTESWVEYGKKATAAQQVGNYDEAIRYWQAAVNISANDAQRANAQQWLDINKDAKRKTSGQQSNTANPQKYSVPNAQTSTTNQDNLKAQNIALATAAAVQVGMVVGEAIQDRSILKRQIKSKLIGNEKLYPEAAIQYYKYKKLRKNSRAFLLSGLGVLMGGLAYKLTAFSRFETYGTLEAYDNTIKVGNGIMYAGGGLSLISFPISLKAGNSLAKAGNLMSYNRQSELKSFFASNSSGHHVGFSLSF